MFLRKIFFAALMSRSFVKWQAVQLYVSLVPRSDLAFPHLEQVFEVNSSPHSYSRPPARSILCFSSFQLSELVVERTIIARTVGLHSLRFEQAGWSASVASGATLCLDFRAISEVWNDGRRTSW